MGLGGRSEVLSGFLHAARPYLVRLPEKYPANDLYGRQANSCQPERDEEPSSGRWSSDVASTFPKLGAWHKMMQSTAGVKGLVAKGVPLLPPAR